jgi:hypothetical protein
MRIRDLLERLPEAELTEKNRAQKRELERLPES